MGTYLDDIADMIDTIQAQTDQIEAQKAEISKLKASLRDALRKVNSTGESNGTL
jgi:prefoldin subunit 5